MNVKERILHFINNNNYNAAYKLSRKYIRKYQSDEQFVILYIMIGIAKDEKEAGVTDIFCVSQEKDINEMIAHYQNIKFCIRRFEYEVGEQARKDAMDYIEKFNVSLYAIYKIAQYACVDMRKALKEISYYFEKNGDFNKSKILIENL